MPLYVSPMDSMYRRYSIIEIGNVEPCVVITTHTMPWMYVHVFMLKWEEIVIQPIRRASMQHVCEINH